MMTLPIDTQRLILSFLNLKDAAAVAACCKSLCNIMRLDEFWQERSLSYFGNITFFPIEITKKEFFKRKFIRHQFIAGKIQSEDKTLIENILKNNVNGISSLLNQNPQIIANTCDYVHNNKTYLLNLFEVAAAFDCENVLMLFLSYKNQVSWAFKIPNLNLAFFLAAIHNSYKTIDILWQNADWETKKAMISANNPEVFYYIKNNNDQLMLAKLKSYGQEIGLVLADDNISKTFTI